MGRLFTRLLTLYSHHVIKVTVKQIVVAHQLLQLFLRASEIFLKRLLISEFKCVLDTQLVKRSLSPYYLDVQFGESAW